MTQRRCQAGTVGEMDRSSGTSGSSTGRGTTEIVYVCVGGSLIGSQTKHYWISAPASREVMSEQFKQEAISRSCRRRRQRHDSTFHSTQLKPRQSADVPASLQVRGGNISGSVHMCICATTWKETLSDLLTAYPHKLVFSPINYRLATGVRRAPQRPI